MGKKDGQSTSPVRAGCQDPRVRPALLIAAALLAAAAGGCATGDDAAPRPSADRATTATVVRVVDGDTLIARVAGRDERVRLLGVDAPESVTPDRPVECFGPEAAREARRRMPAGAPLELVADPTQGARDRFGRLLAEVTVDGRPTTVNEDLVAGGFAEVFRGDGRARLLPALRTAESAARRARRGLWSACRRGG
jgi:micrococcal nuclease